MQPGIASAKGTPGVNPTLAGVSLTLGGIKHAVLAKDFKYVEHESVSERQTITAS
jgi:hypothetical protein